MIEFIVCLILALMIVPFANWIDYKIDCKRFGKNIADAIRNRWWQ